MKATWNTDFLDIVSKVNSHFFPAQSAVPSIFGIRNWFCGRQFFYRPVRGMVLGWFKHIIFILYFYYYYYYVRPISDYQAFSFGGCGPLVKILFHYMLTFIVTSEESVVSLIIDFSLYFHFDDLSFLVDV